MQFWRNVAVNTTMPILLSPAEMGKLLAGRTKTLRLLTGWTRDQLFLKWLIVIVQLYNTR